MKPPPYPASSSGMHFSTVRSIRANAAADEHSGRANPARLRFCPPWLTGLFLVVGVACIASAVPDVAFEQRIAESGAVDPVTNTYVRAWLLNEPENESMRLAAAWQSFRTGKFAEAGSDLVILAQSSDAVIRRETTYLQIELAERILYATDPANPERIRRLVEFREMLTQRAGEDWSITQLTRLARKARDSGVFPIAAELYERAAARGAEDADQWTAAAARVWLDAGSFKKAIALYIKLASRPGADVGKWYAEGAQAAIANNRGKEAAELYLRLAEQPGQDSAKWNREAARLLVAAGDLVAAARLYFKAIESTESRDARRELFRDGLKTLQAASRFDEALAAADRYGQEFLVDIETVEFLARLARAGNRLDAAERYVRLMLRLSRIDVSPPNRASKFAGLFS